MSGEGIAESFCVLAAVGLAAVWHSGATRPGALAFFATGPFANLARRSVSLVVRTHPRNAVFRGVRRRTTRCRQFSQGGGMPDNAEQECCRSSTMKY